MRALAWITLPLLLATACGDEPAAERATADGEPARFPEDVGPGRDCAPAPPQQAKPAAASPKATATLKVMTYNIRGSAQTPATLAAIAAFIATERPDVVGLQEVYRYIAQGANQAALLATALAAAGKPYHVRYEEQHSFIVAGIGVAVLSRHPLIATSAHGLPKVETENRVVLRARVATPPRPVELFVTHLTNQSEGVELQAQALASWVGGFAGPQILVGDFNAGPSSSVHKLLDPSFVDTWSAANGAANGFTIPSSKPAARIDFIFVDRASSTRVIDSRVAGDAALSDHLAVITTIELSE